MIVFLFFFPLKKNNQQQSQLQATRRPAEYCKSKGIQGCVSLWKRGAEGGASFSFSLPSGGRRRIDLYETIIAVWEIIPADYPHRHL